MLTTQQTVYQEGDLVHLLVRESDADRVEAHLAQLPEGL
jgi:hypothetical protein